MWQQRNTEIVKHEEIMENHFLLTLIAPEIIEEVKPGQFINVRATKQLDPLLRRPISIFGADSSKGELSIVYRVVGRGTEMLSKKKAGELLDIIGPLGNGFLLPPNDPNHVLVIGGGIGLAPLQFLVRTLINDGHKVTLIAGLRNKEQLPLLELFPKTGVELIITTDDGSFGKQGIVTEVSADLLKESNISMLYSCGPEAMLAAVAKQAHGLNIPCQVSVERTMACGVGACLGCVCELKKDNELKYAHVCQDGPVFWGNEVIF
ncbi:MAG: dihydroorotate dehydrogenase electron transfer subunit [Bacillota bacterium]|nr:dihydroorotate dehydrogenase electron transfer subunit [Bacillota bacterium]